MSTEIKPILVFAIISMFALSFISGKCEECNNKQTDIVAETTEDEVIEGLTEEVEIEEVEEYTVIWTIANANIQREPNINSEIVGECHWNAQMSVTYINDDWAKIKDTEYYINRRFISETPTNFSDYDVPANNTIKSYMDYRCITLTSSRQYKLQKSLGYTDNNGIRMVSGRYCIAVGSYYTTTIGQYIDVELENGNVIKAILADCKDNTHTDITNRINPNGSVVEFVVDIKSLDVTAKKMGDISYVNGWNSKIVNIKIYDKVEEF